MFCLALFCTKEKNRNKLCNTNQCIGSLQELEQQMKLCSCGVSPTGLSSIL